MLNLIAFRTKDCMMTSPIALQLYTVRDALANDYEGTIRKVAAMGYAGVETAGNYNGAPEKALALFRELGLQVMGGHFSLPLGDDKNKILDTAAALETNTLICPWLSPDNFTTLDSIKKVCDMLNEANANAQARGMRLGYHNHHFEFEKLPDGSLPHEHMRRLCDNSIFFELDTYWIKTAGVDPASVVSELAGRAPLLHIKDGPAVVGQPMVAAGEGVIDIPAVINAGAGNTEWLIVELDQCATNMLTAVETSINYLKSKGLGRGK
jgi:sugar phosphate isomerase/epimerase